MKNIMFIISDISKLGGVERITSSLSNELSNFFAVYIFNTNCSSPNEPKYHIQNNVKILYSKKTRNMLSQLLYTKKILLRYKIDTIIIQTKSLYYFAYLRCLTRKNIVFVDHDSIKAYPSNQKNEYLPRKRIINKVNKIVLLTEENKKEYLDRFKIDKAKITVIPNYVDSPIGLIKYDCDSKEIIAVGRYHNQKRFDLLIESFSLIARKYPEWSIKIFGNGDQYNYLQSLIIHKNLSNQIFLCGESKDKKGMYENKAFLCCTSEHEGFCLVLLEALSYKLPVISFNAPSGPSEIIDDGKNGFLINNGDCVLFSKAMENMIKNKHLRELMSSNSHYSLNKYNKKNIILKWRSIL